MRYLPAVVGMLMIASAGCGPRSDHPDLGRVQGTVTLDGQPLGNAVLTFSPMTEARQSYGRTDARGSYDLFYTDDARGAVPGTHRVTITTYDSGNPEEDVAATPEKLPARYNTRTELTAEVQSGRNTIDFALTSEGETIVETD